MSKLIAVINSIEHLKKECEKLRAKLDEYYEQINQGSGQINQATLVEKTYQDVVNSLRDVQHQAEKIKKHSGFEYLSTKKPVSEEEEVFYDFLILNQVLKVKAEMYKSNLQIAINALRPLADLTKLNAKYFNDKSNSYLKRFVLLPAKKFGDEEAQSLLGNRAFPK